MNEAEYNYWKFFWGMFMLSVVSISAMAFIYSSRPQSDMCYTLPAQTETKK